MKNFNLKIQIKNQLDFLSNSNNSQSSSMKSFCSMFLAMVFLLLGIQAKSQTCTGDITPPIITCSPMNVSNTSGMCGANVNLVAPAASDNCSLIGNALHFDGANDKIIFPGSFPAYNGSTLTLEAWIKSTNGGPGFPNSEIVTWSGGGGYSIVFRIANYLGNGRLQFLIYDNVTVQYVEGTTDLNTNTWNHVAVVKNGNNVTLYLNGNIEASGTMTNGFVPAQCSIGGGFASWDGTLDEVRIWHTVRTQAQIQASMNIPMSAQPGLAALYHFDEGDANGNNVAVTTANDASGNGFHGTLSTFALTGSTSNWVNGTITNITNNAPSSFPVGTTNVVWTATDASGNSATCTQVVTVTDNQAPVFGGSGLSAVPSLASSNVPEASQYQVVYELDMPVNADYNSTAIPYTINHSSVSGIDFSRVAYFMQLDNNWVWVSMDKFNPIVSLTQLGIPNVAFNNVVWQQTVSNMNVFSNVGAAVTNATGISGNIEMWHRCYNGNLGLAGIGGNSGNFDFNDLPDNSNACWGSFQVHNYNAAQTIFAYNAWDSGNADDMGFGNRPTSDPDWTFAGNAGAYTTRKLYILVNPVGCPPNITVNALPGSCQAVATYTATPTDNCGVASVTYTPASGSTFNIGTTPVSVSATDIHGNTSSCTFNVIVVDNTAPTISCQANISQNVDAGLCSATINTTAPTINDNCGIDKLTWVMSGATTATSPSTGINNIGTIVCNKGVSTIVYTLTDISGNTATCSFTISVIDNIPPTITCGSNINVNNTPGMCSASVNLVAPAVSDNCSMAPNLALDFNGTPNYATLPPDVYFNGNFTIECWVYPKAFTNWSRIIDFGNGAASNNVLLAYTYQNSGKPGLYIQGTQIQSTATLPLNQWSHIAATFNSGTGTIFVNGLPAGSGTFPTPVNIVRNLNYIGRSNWGSAGDPDANAIYDELRIWNIARTQSQIQSTMNSSLQGNESGLQVYFNFDQGTACGNNTSITQLQDAAPAGGTSNATLFNFTLNGGCTKNFTNGVPVINNGGIVNNAPTSYPVGSTNVVWTATDANGNTASCTQVVTVTDTEAPVFQSGTGITDYIFSTANNEILEDMSSGATTLFGINVDDAGSTPITMPFVFSYNGVIRTQFSVSSNGLVGFANSNVTSDFSNSTNDNYPDVLYAYWDDLHTGTNGSVIYKVVGIAPNRKLVIQWQVRSFSNDGGAGFTKTFQAWLHEGNNKIDYVFGNGTNSGTGGSTIGLRGANSTIFNEVTTATHTNSITTINDANIIWPGAGRSYSFILNSCPVNITAYSVQGACDKNVSWTAPSPIDNCAIASLTSTHNPGDLFPVGATTVVYTATDIHGNSSACSFDVTVVDTNLFATCAQNVTVGTDAFQCAANLLPSTPTLLTNCAPINTLTWNLSGATSGSSATSGINYLGATTFNQGQTIITYTATNSFGHVSHCSFTVQVNDSILPTIICSPNIIVNHGQGSCGATLTLTPPSVSDNCTLSQNSNALNFDGINDHVNVPNLSLFTNNITMECWVKPNGLQPSAAGIIFNRDGVNASGLNFGYAASDKIGYHWDDNPSTYLWTGGPTYNLNQWNHVALVIEPTHATVYLNGVPYVNNVSNPALDIGNLIKLGVDNFSPSRHFNGEMDEVRIWNYARSQSQILTAMNSEIYIEPGLVASYHFNEGVAGANNAGLSTANDASSNSYHGTLQNFGLNGPTSNWVAGILQAPLQPTSNAPSVFPIGTTNVVWTATDASGNSATCSQSVTVLGPSGNTTVTSCDTYTWVENNNAIYTVSGNYTQTFTTVYGCDSIHTLNLTVNYSSKTVTSISTIGCYTWPINGGTYTVSGMYTNTYTNGVGCLHTDSLYLTITPEVLLHGKAILQGPYDASVGLMHDSLRVQNAIPTLEPYSQLPYNKPAIGEPGGELLNLSLLTTTGNDAIVDWIFLELRDAINPSIIVATKRALIQRDGDIVSHVDGLSPIHFLHTSAGNYYVSIKHRNHLGVMSSTPIALSACAGSTINFSDLTPVYINPVIQNLPRKNLVTLNALWSADANNNKNVKYNGALNDKDKIMTGVGGPGLINNIVYGYRVEDCNMDGKIRYNGLDNDRTLIITNVGVSTPNNVLFQHTPN